MTKRIKMELHYLIITLNHVHPEKSGVCTNYDSEDQYYPLYRINKSEFKG